MDYLLPWLKSYKDDEKTAVATVFALEHVLLFTVFALKLLLDRDPEWIQVFLARRTYRQENQKEYELQKLRTQLSMRKEGKDKQD
jgi:hypothetical protein